MLRYNSELAQARKEEANRQETPLQLSSGYEWYREIEMEETRPTRRVLEIVSRSPLRHSPFHSFGLLHPVTSTNIDPQGRQLLLASSLTSETCFHRF